MTTRVVLTDSDLGDAEVERVALGEGVELLCAQARTADDVIEAAQGAAGLLVQWAPIDDRVVAALPDLKAVVRLGVGLDNIDLAAAKARGVAVSNVPDYCIDEVANHAFAMIMVASRRLFDFGQATAAGRWSPDVAPAPLPPPEDPIGIAGFGRIGRAITERARAAGFRVLAFDPFLAEEAFGGVERVDSLDDLAAAVNHLTLHLPASEATDKICGKDVLSALGPSGHLVNTARGLLVDEEALLAALDSGALWRASLDVLRFEPPTGTSAALVAHPRVLVSPHVAYLSTASAANLRRRAAERLRDLLGLGGA